MEQLKRSLGPWGASSVVVGTIIGTGIFLKTANMTNLLGSQSYVMLAWIVAGILSYAGALTYAELCAITPTSGGEYALLKTGYGKMPAFLFGWMRFLIGSPGSIASYAVGSATFLSGVLALDVLGGPKVVAIAFIVIFTLVNCLQLSFGSKVQTGLTILKVFLILGLTLGLFIFLPAASNENLEAFNIPFSISNFGLAMVAALWAYDGWNNLPMIGEEIKNPKKNFPIALGLGMLLVIVLYLSSNMGYFHALNLAEISTSNSSLHPTGLPVATNAAQKFLGDFGVPLLSIAFVISALGAMNGSILTGGRVPFAMARDGLFFKKLAEVNAKSNVPVISILVQAVVSIILAMSGTFDQLTDYVVVASWIFYAVTTSTIFVMRKRNLKNDGFKVPFYPILPILFILTSSALVLNSIVRNPKEGMIGLGIIALGIPVYYFFEKKNKLT